MASSVNLKELSSNWKKLQQQLQTESTATRKNSVLHDHSTPRPESLKRKALNGHGKEKKHSPSVGPIKRQKLSHAFGPRPSKLPHQKQAPKDEMGNYLSSVFHASPAAPAAPSATQTSTIKDAQQPIPGKYIALDCEMVGTHDITPFSVHAHTRAGSITPTPGAPPAREYSILARVSLTSFTHETLYDALVLPPPDVTISDYRTRWSGITAAQLAPGGQARPFAAVQAEVAALLEGRVLVGHALRNDLAVLGLQHPRRDMRDTAHHAAFRALAAAGPEAKGRTPALRRLAREVLGWEIQADASAGHDSVEDARAAMELFKRERRAFEEEVVRRYGVKERTKEVVADEGEGVTATRKKKKRRKRGKK